jgi:hypothetical protein
MGYNGPPPKDKSVGFVPPPPPPVLRPVPQKPNWLAIWGKRQGPGMSLPEVEPEVVIEPNNLPPVDDGSAKRHYDLEDE